MARTTGIATGFAGAAVAAAIIVVAGSTIGFGESAGSDAPAGATAAVAGAPVEGPLGDAFTRVPGSEVVTTASGEQVEYLYVDQPSGRYDDDDDHDEHDDDHHDEDDEHEDDEDDD